MKRMLLAAVMLASTLGVAQAQTQTFHFGEGHATPAGATTARRAPARRHVAHHRHAVHKRRHAPHVKSTRGGLYTRS
ncbi:hypothetical protein [Burkholderia multivorans]|uniref:hypothetical protein n=1 Tax=Burkholderia multivorans TaxID=87883 RepID=UPI0012DC39B2|nr:hypothetical protein [Burkholderia multivorans]MBU9339604.1 hypothetical protein [Burkholderia multivorans]MCA8139813.1 hypothetical protein [Burkholderia multivorans]MCO1366651.1 hypothetical protein [Burkholderia multivorans]MCO1376260.1 hypothetical protein [Burkholderia multivorans]QGR60913.1 hypothetical protein FOC27_12115 [Burkholderia multivorans]